jgi:hypothetical protein
MKMLLGTLLLILTLCTHSVLVGLGVRIVFNRGQTESQKWCSATDWLKVCIALDAAAARRRQQQRALGSVSSASTGQKARHLTFCDTICRFFKPKTCYLSGTGCRNRRALTESVDFEATMLADEQRYDTMDARHLYADHECAEKKNRLVNGLNSIQNNVAQTCRNLITSQHDLTCYDV